MAVSAPGAYEEWQQALAQEFFSERHAGVPVIFWVDRDTVDEMAERYSLETLLADAVRERLDMSARSRIFWRIVEECDQPRSPEQVPPSLPLLAATVVAASMMASDGEIRVSNYYTPLYRFLFGDSFEEDARAAIMQSAEQFAYLWRQLDDWLASTDGRFGFSTIKGHSSHTRIGYPISQAILRASDRRALTQFFRDARIEPGTPASPGYLQRALRLWAQQHPKAFSSSFLAIYKSSELSEFAAKIVEEAANTWDGAVIDSSYGRQLVRLRVRLRKDRRKIKLGWAAEHTDGIEGGILEDSQGGSHSFARDYGDFYEGLDDLPFPSQQLYQSLVLSATTTGGNKVSFSYQPSDVLFFREDAELGWVSQSTVAPFDEHMILAVDASGEVTRLLRACGANDVISEEASFAPGWKLYRGVVFDDEAKLYSALRNKAPALQSFRPTGPGKPKLDGGLPIRQRLASHVYLVGGPPDLLLGTEALDSRSVRLLLDGSYTAEVQAKGFPVPLTYKHVAAPGRHTVAADGVELAFELVEVLADGPAPGTGSLGFLVEGRASSRVTKTREDGQFVQGALLPEPAEDEPPVLAYTRASEILLISHDGRLSKPAPQDQTKLYERLHLDSGKSYYTEVPVPPSWSGWMVEAHRTGNRFTGIRLQAPDRAAVTASAEREDWAVAVLNLPGSLKEPSENSVWQQYRDLAEEVAR